MAEFIDVDPGELYLPSSRRYGADPGKFARQILSRRVGPRGSDSDAADSECDPREKGEGLSTMKSQERAELLTAIEQLCERYPHWRLGQLIANVAGWADQEIWDVEDQQLSAAARLHLSQLTPRESVSPGRTGR